MPEVTELAPTRAIAAAIGADATALASLGLPVVPGEGNVAESETNPGAAANADVAALADDATPDGALDVRITALEDAPGGGGLLTAIAHLSSADILAMHTDPPIIVPAPGASQIIVPVSVLFIFNKVTTPYTPTGGDWTLYVSTASDMGDPIGDGNAGSWFKFSQPILGFTFSSMFLVPTLPGGQDDKEFDTSIGEALQLYTSGLTIAFTGGDGTLDVVTKYYLLDTPVVADV
jgi:hypothetical protein